MIDIKKIFLDAQKKWNAFLAKIFDENDLDDKGAFNKHVRKFLRAFYLSIKGFARDDCQLHSTALTYNTLLAFIPILIVTIALGRAFGGEELLQSKVVQWTSDLATKVEQVATDRHDLLHPGAATNMTASVSRDLAFTQSFTTDLKNTSENLLTRVSELNFKALGFIGFGGLIFMVISMLSKIEKTFNKIWGVAKGRNIWRKFSDYLAIILLVPALLSIFLSIPVLDLVHHIFYGKAVNVLNDAVNNVFVNRCLVLSGIALVFALVYMIIPNTKVKFIHALVGGFIVALLLAGWLWFCMVMQVGVVKASRIYGSLAVIPIILLWVLISWQIILYGAEFASALMNNMDCDYSVDGKNVSFASKLTLVIAIVIDNIDLMINKNGQNFCVEDFAKEYKLPTRLLNEIISDLDDLDYISAVESQPGFYSFKRSPADLTVAQVTGDFAHLGLNDTNAGLGRVPKNIMELVKKVDKALQNDFKNTSLRDFVKNT
jgi:membrane protein